MLLNPVSGYSMCQANDTSMLSPINLAMWKAFVRNLGFGLTIFHRLLSDPYNTFTTNSTPPTICTTY